MQYDSLLQIPLGIIDYQASTTYQSLGKTGHTFVFTGTLTDLTRSHTDLIVENALLRQPLIVLNRQAKRPQLTHFDRFQLHSIVYFLRVMLRSFTCQIKLPKRMRFRVLKEYVGYYNHSQPHQG
jgi:hypothetical protein